MRINASISKISSLHAQFEFQIQNGLCEIKGFDLLTKDELDILQKDLNEISDKVYAYRQSIKSED